jgi:hypothetical protein
MTDKEIAKKTIDTGVMVEGVFLPFGYEEIVQLLATIRRAGEDNPHGDNYYKTARKKACYLLNECVTPTSY